MERGAPGYTLPVASRSPSRIGCWCVLPGGGISVCHLSWAYRVHEISYVSGRRSTKICSQCSLCRARLSWGMAFRVFGRTLRHPVVRAPSEFCTTVATLRATSRAPPFPGNVPAAHVRRILVPQKETPGFDAFAASWRHRPPRMSLKSVAFCVYRGPRVLRPFRGQVNPPGGRLGQFRTR